MGHVLPQMLEWIAEHEAADPEVGTSAEAAEGVDYGAIYRHLAHLMTGDVPPDLNKATADRIIQLFVTLKEAVKEALPTLDKVRARITTFEFGGLYFGFALRPSFPSVVSC